MSNSLNIKVFDSAKSLAEHGADIIAGIQNRCRRKGRSFVLGLAAGSSPRGIYNMLIKRSKSGEMDFRDCLTFCLDEYYPLPLNSPMSFFYELSILQDQLGIPRENRYFFKGDISLSVLEDHCIQYEQMIRQAGGIDLQLLGVGRNGHIGFNEPGSESYSRTRRVLLSKTTVTDALPKFGSLDSSPKEALTMGIGTILEAKALLLIAEGAHKKHIMTQFIKEPPTSKIPVTFIKHHKAFQILIDAAASPKNIF